MRAQSRGRSDSRTRTLALLVICALGLTLLSGARSFAQHRQAPHHVAVVAASGAETVHILHRLSAPAALPPALARHPALAVSTGFAKSSSLVSSRTAQTPPVRGPPGQALA